ncbi:MAG: DUF4252 domain-containing protein [Phocaeicola sp.]|nr:DUF4252 domain-containing protein [Phocaeicola sp.]
MKRIVFLFIITWCATYCFGQESSLEKFTDMDGVKSVYISKAMLSLMPSLDVDGVDIGKTATKLDNIQILSTEKTDIREKMSKEVKALASKGKVEELMRVKEDGENVHIYMKDLGNKKNEFILFNDDKDELTIIIITGSLTLTDIQNIVNK